MSQIDLKIEARHASLVAMLAAKLIDVVIQSTKRGPAFMAALETAFEGKYHASTDADGRVAWYQALHLVRIMKARVALPSSPLPLLQPLPLEDAHPGI